MANTIIKVEGIGKKYNIVHNATEPNDSLVGAFASGLKNIASFQKSKKSVEEFWALRDVNFEIEKGDRVGIIGRNGAGKSTLLKILSRIVKPTTGKIEFEGRMASLLEVGTGFHGDLSGRENIYLNGSILGMSKREIDAKFDEIVAFSEIEKFLDTPVKRYSSGMYVRLAFAVAAHLEPDILIVDEVLAVGDASFQKKCLGKMEEVSQGEGKTILFVSHNMGQIASLCNKGILLSKGKVERTGNINDIISQYFNNSADEKKTTIEFENSSSKEYFFKKVSIINSKHVPTDNFAHNEPIIIELEISKQVDLSDVLLGLHFYDIYDKRIFTSQLLLSDKFQNKDKAKFTLEVPANTFTANQYYFSIGIHIPNIQLVDEKKLVGSFTVYDNGSEFYKYNNSDIGLVFVNCKWIY